MALTIIGQMDLNSNPFVPEMIVEGELLYRPTNSTIRKATFVGATDVLLATLTNFGASNSFENNKGSVSFDDYYVVTDSNGGSPLITWWMNAIHRITGSVSSFQGSNTDFRTSSYLAKSSSEVMHYGVDVGTTGVRQAKIDVPITSGLETVKGLNPPNNMLFPAAGTITPIGSMHYIQGDLNTTPVTGGDAAPLFSIGSSAPYVAARNNAGVWKVKTGLGTLIYQRGTGYLAHPTVWLNDGTYVYGFCSNVYAAKILYWRATIASLPSIYTTQDFYDTNIDNGGFDPQGKNQKSIAIQIDLERIYFCLLANKIYASPLWPMDLSNSLTLGAASPSAGHTITGIWVFPPYIYASVTNNSSPTVNPKLYKIHDSTLDALVSIDLNSSAAINVSSENIIESSIKETVESSISQVFEYTRGDLDAILLEETYKDILQMILDDFTPEMVRQYQESILFKSFVEALAEVMAEARMQISNSIKQLNIQQAATLFLNLWSNITGISRQNINGVLETDVQYRKRLLDSIFWDKISNNAIKKSILLRLGFGSVIQDRSYSVSQRAGFVDPTFPPSTPPTAKYLSNLVEISLDGENPTDDVMSTVYDEVFDLLAAGNVIADIARSVSLIFLDINAAFGRIAYGPIFMQWATQSGIKSTESNWSVAETIYADNQYKMQDNKIFDGNRSPDDIVSITRNS
jgi:hypothetical protein